MALGKGLECSPLQFPHLYNEANNNGTALRGLVVGGLSEANNGEFRAQSLAWLTLLVKIGSAVGVWMIRVLVAKGTKQEG